MLVFFVHHLVHSIQLDEIMGRVERSSVHVVEHDLPTVAVTSDPCPEPPVWAVAVPAERSGYVQTVHPEGLVTDATAKDVVLSLTTMVGGHVVRGAPLAWAWRLSPEQPPPQPADLRAAVRRAVRIGNERTMEQDVAFGIRQLADIASKALSPGINDPYTAVQALQHLSVVMATLAGRRLGNQLFRDGAGVVRVAVPHRDLGYLLDLAFGQIRRYGAAEPRVVEALLRVLRSTGRFCVDDAARALVAAQVRLVLADAESAIRQPADLLPVREHAGRVLREVSG
jgi:uncharacterized membrane protein